LKAKVPKKINDNSGPKPIDAAGGVVYKFTNDKPFVLMIYKKGYWDLPKGKVDKGESKKKAAAREVSEETGSELPEIVKKLAVTEHTYIDDWGWFTKTTYWYAMTTNAQKFSPESKEGIEKVCWIELDQAIELAGFENLKTVLIKLKKWLEKK
jgi:8-oxo-dGTP pyrophosphatase MutT (NUDIX family)